MKNNYVKCIDTNMHNVFDKDELYQIQYSKFIGKDLFYKIVGFNGLHNSNNFELENGELTR